MKYLIVGATGNIGSRVTQRLIARGERPSVFVRNAKKAKALFGAQVDIHVGDLDKAPSSLATALDGANGVFLVSDGPDLDTRDRTVAFAAKSAGVGHLVKLSTLDVHTGVGTGPWHARGEAAVRESGVAFTFIQAAGFMLNALGWSDSIREEGVLRTSTGNGRIAFIHPDDIADVATAVLTTRDYDSQSLVITGPEALSYGEMAATIGKAIDKPIQFEEISDRQACAGVVAWAGKGPYADALVDIWRAVREGRLATVSDGVTQVIGRKPISFGRWAEENAGAFR
ncbi:MULTISPECIES: NAD(P)H-binding protein [unclassified Rhizobium]|uniref:NAD(P)H-binding protein n=1 Tax=unclassified Rhizobium TaxID=2613769 RepID=UPI000EA95588|nr:MULTISPECIES: NAD(P)H-binding protein [unclassified Rhizobium]AYG69982.1 NmrA family protein [Rhizobium sp. CCGE531]AYG76358.1 NmrA family protein [Rhizobium sp. CCGE532]